MSQQQPAREVGAQIVVPILRKIAPGTTAYRREPCVVVRCKGDRWTAEDRHGRCHNLTNAALAERERKADEDRLLFPERY